MGKLCSLLALFLCSPLYSQQGRQQALNHVDFTGGLNTKYPSNLIADNETQSALNVLFDNRRLVKRGGQKKQNPTALGGGTHDIIGLYEYKKSNGTDYCVAFSSRTGYYSTDNCATFTAFISTLTVDEEVNCVPFQDRLYCVNGADTAFYFDGTAYTLVTGLPNAKYLRVHQNRLWAAGNTTQKSYIYYSNVGDGTAWDTTLQWVGFNPEDGDVLTGIGQPLYEVLPVYKKYSAWVVQGNSADNYTPVIVNDSIGANSHRDIRNFLLRNTKTLQLFSSVGIRGGEPGIYSFNGIVIEYLSDKIRDDLRDLDTFHSTDRYRQWTSGDDWNTGTLVAIDTATMVGVIQPPQWTRTDTTPADWVAGTLNQASTIPISGSVALDGERFNDGNYTTSPIWTPILGTWSVSNGRLLATGALDIIFTSSSWNAGIISFDIGRSLDDALSVYIMSTMTITGSAPYANPYVYVLIDSTQKSLIVSSDTIQIVCTITNGHVQGSTVSYVVSKVGNNWTLSDGVNSCSGSNSLSMTSRLFGFRKHFGSGTTSWIDNIIGGFYVSSGTFTSAIFDTTFSTPIGGPLSFTETVPVGSTIAYSVRESSYNNVAGMGSWNLVSTTTSGAYRIPLTKRYWQYKNDFSTDYSTQTPQLLDITLNAASTGYWTSPEVLLDADISSWGLFQADQITTGQAAWAYFIRASTYSGGTTSASWSAIANNTTIGITTGAYVQVRSSNTFVSSTETARVDSITVNYKAGASAKSAVGEVYRNRYYWYAQSQNGANNDIAYVLDANAAWGKFDAMKARSVVLIRGNMYTGDSLTAASGFIRQQDTGNSDDDATIASHWQSKDYLFGSDDVLKTVDNIYLTYRNNPATVTTELYGDGVLARSWDVQLSTSSSFGVKSLSSVTTGGWKRAKYFNIKFSNTSLNPWELLGFRMYWTPLQVLQP